MPTAPQIKQALARVEDLTSLVNELLRETLGWPLEDKIVSARDGDARRPLELRGASGGHASNCGSVRAIG